MPEAGVAGRSCLRQSPVPVPPRLFLRYPFAGPDGSWYQPEIAKRARFRAIPEYAALARDKVTVPARSRVPSGPRQVCCLQTTAGVRVGNNRRAGTACWKHPVPTTRPGPVYRRQPDGRPGAPMHAMRSTAYRTRDYPRAIPGELPGMPLGFPQWPLKPLCAGLGHPVDPQSLQGIHPNSSGPHHSLACALRSHGSRPAKYS